MAARTRPDDEDVEPSEETPWYALETASLAEAFIVAERDYTGDYWPEDLTRAKMLLCAERLAMTGSERLAANSVGWPKNEMGRYRERFAPFDLILSMAADAVGGKVRAALVQKAIGNEPNVHAQIHLDRLFNRADYEPQQAPAPQLRISLSATINPKTIPVGDPSKVLDATGHIVEMEAPLGLAAADRDEALAPGWLDTHNRWLLAPAGERPGDDADDGDSEAPDGDGDV